MKLFFPAPNDASCLVLSNLIILIILSLILLPSFFLLFLSHLLILLPHYCHLPLTHTKFLPLLYHLLPRHLLSFYLFLLDLLHYLLLRFTTSPLPCLTTPLLPQINIQASSSSSVGSPSPTSLPHHPTPTNIHPDGHTFQGWHF